MTTTKPTEAEEAIEAAAHAEHFASHVQRCDRAKALLADATTSLREVAGLLHATYTENWGSDGELSTEDHGDATEHYTAALLHIRNVGRVVALVRADAEQQRQLNAEGPRCFFCNSNNNVSKQYDADRDPVWLCPLCSLSPTA